MERSMNEHAARNFSVEEIEKIEKLLEMKRRMDHISSLKNYPSVWDILMLLWVTTIFEVSVIWRPQNQSRMKNILLRIPITSKDVLPRVRMGCGHEEMVWSRSSMWMCALCLVHGLVGLLEAGISLQGRNLISVSTRPEARGILSNFTVGLFQTQKSVKREVWKESHFWEGGAGLRWGSWLTPQEHISAVRIVFLCILFSP